MTAAYMFTNANEDAYLGSGWDCASDELTDEEREMEDLEYALMYDLEEDVWIDPA